MSKKVECQVCHKVAKFTIQCLCDKWLCSRCTCQDYSHSSCHDPYHVDLFWKMHPTEYAEAKELMEKYGDKS